MTLDQYLSITASSAKSFAESLGISPSYLSELRGGKKRPGLSLALEIERATKGKVKARSWMDTDAPAQRLEGAA
jgi:DNA-binding transcriptional regulator YdaS (Cro superfamily)